MEYHDSSQPLSPEDVEWRLREAGLTVAPNLLANLAEDAKAGSDGGLSDGEALEGLRSFIEAATSDIVLAFAALEKCVLDLEPRER